MFKEDHAKSILNTLKKLQPLSSGQLINFFEGYMQYVNKAPVKWNSVLQIVNKYLHQNPDIYPQVRTHLKLSLIYFHNFNYPDSCLNEAISLLKEKIPNRNDYQIYHLRLLNLVENLCLNGDLEQAAIITILGCRLAEKIEEVASYLQVFLNRWKATSDHQHFFILFLLVLLRSLDTPETARTPVLKFLL